MLVYRYILGPKGYSSCGARKEAKHSNQSISRVSQDSFSVCTCALSFLYICISYVRFRNETFLVCVLSMCYLYVKEIFTV